jgi:uncharacterized protein DUF1501
VDPQLNAGLVLGIVLYAIPSLTASAQKASPDSDVMPATGRPPGRRSATCACPIGNPFSKAAIPVPPWSRRHLDRPFLSNRADEEAFSGKLKQSDKDALAEWVKGTTTPTSRKGLMSKCKSVDKPIAGLLTDLKAPGLLKDTLILWLGEFGRTRTASRTPR